MTKESSLSDKSWKVISDPSNDDYDLDVIETKHVREAVKRLKKILLNNKFNIPFEYGMMQILNKPIMLICEENLDLDFKSEFSDISNIQHGEKFKLYKQQEKIEIKIKEIFIKFIPELAKTMVKKVLEDKEFIKISHRDANKLKGKLRKVYETMLQQEFNN